jgi:hypothetical protein
MRFKLQCFIPELPFTPSALNNHGIGKSEYTEYWQELVGAAVAGRKPVAPLKRAAVTLVRYSSVRPDEANLKDSFDPVVSALIECGIIDNLMVGSVSYLWEFSKPKDGKIFLRVEERTVGAVECITEVQSKGDRI